MSLTRFLRRTDPLLAGSALILASLSLVLLGTGSAGGFGGSFFLRQAVFLGISLIVFIVVSRMHYGFLRTLAPIAYVVIIGFLLLVLKAEAIRGAASWIQVGTFHLQPGELAKVVLVITLAKVLSERPRARPGLRTIVLTAIYAGIPIALVLIQPDLGTAALLAFLWFGMLLVAGVRRRTLALLLAVIATAAVLSWFFLLQDYQKQRLEVFLNPGADPLGAGYTVLQSVTAFGSGGLWGRGLGYGPQSRLNFLPEHHTDFIFARLGEELGFVGAAGVLVLYGVILLRILQAAARTSDPFGRLLAIGAFLTLLVGVCVNAGMNIGLLPVTGVPLPLVSYGGSSLLTMFLLLAAVASVRVHGEQWGTEEEEADVPVPVADGQRPGRGSLPVPAQLSRR